MYFVCTTTLATTKITADEVMEMRKLHDKGVSFVDIGIRFNTSRKYAYNVVTRRARKEVL